MNSEKLNQLYIDNEILIIFLLIIKFIKNSIPDKNFVKMSDFFQKIVSHYFSNKNGLNFIPFKRAHFNLSGKFYFIILSFFSDLL
jgi:dolichol kinase